MPFFLRNALAAIIRRAVGGLISAVCITFGFVPSRWFAGFISAPPIWLNNSLIRIGVIAIGVTVILITFFLDRYKRPKFIFTFDAKRDIHHNVPLFDLTTSCPLGIDATYVHMQAAAKGAKNIIQCEGWITCIEQLDGNRKTITKIDELRPLIWAPREYNETKIALAPGTPRDLDIFRSIQNHNALELLSVGHSRRWITFFAGPGIYRLTINVVGDGASIRRRLKIIWNGQWNNFTVS